MAIRAGVNIIAYSTKRDRKRGAIGLADSLCSHDRLEDNKHNKVIVTHAPNSGAELKTKLIPRGTFAGTTYQPSSVENGQLVACDTAEHGGGQS